MTSQTGYLASPAHREFLDSEALRLLAFGSAAAHPGKAGAAYLDDAGRPIEAQGIQTWITCRMVHSFSLGALMGLPGCAAIAEAALAGLTGPLLDAEFGGWFHAVSDDGAPDLASGKTAYDHAFVMLAASSATIAGLRGGAQLLAEATAVFLTRFWDDVVGRPIDSWNRDFTEADPYRGLNSSMHTLEAMLSVAAAVDGADRAGWLDRAARIALFVVELAKAHEGRLPEHFGSNWDVDLELNADRPGDQFKPYGVTPGHGLEWARLLLHTEAALGADDPRTAELLPTAIALFDRAVADGWAADGADGFVYTTNWQGEPVVRERMHWVLCEALAAAAVLFDRTGDRRYESLYQGWWSYAETYLLDTEKGSWHHELDTQNRPAASVWPGKPDIYHAFQCVLIPRLPRFPMVAGALHDGSLR